MKRKNRIINTTPREKKKQKQTNKINSIFTEYDLSYLNIMGIDTKGLPNPCPVEVIDGYIKIIYNGKTESLW